MEFVASRLMSVDDSWLSTWFVNNYIRKCSVLCPDSVSALLSDVSTNTKLQNAVSAVVNWRLTTPLIDTWRILHEAHSVVAYHEREFSLTVRLFDNETGEDRSSSSTLFHRSCICTSRLYTEYQGLVSLTS